LQDGTGGTTATTKYTVDLYLALHYLNGFTASELESLDPTNGMVSHFCKSVNFQVRVPWEFGLLRRKPLRLLLSRGGGVRLVLFHSLAHPYFL